MQRVRVKICGLTSVPDARLAVEAGADAVGLMFYEKSPRCVSLEQAAAIVLELPPLVAKVGVFVDPTWEKVTEAVQRCGLDTVQLHGSEAPEFCARIPVKVIKAFRVRGPETLRAAEAYRGQAWLLDSYVPDQPGGTGATFNWDLAREAVALNPHIILAGGLTAANVATAIRRVQPYAVDVSSGVESAPGRKDTGKMREFVAAVRSAGVGN